MGTQENFTEATANQDPGDEGVTLQEKKGNTVTVESKKTVNGVNFSFVSISPTKRSFVDGQQIKHIRAIQDTEKRNWHGLDCNQIGRPGL